MTAPITSNGPTTTRLHHYAGRYLAGSRKPGARLSETGVAFACSCPCGVETLVAFAGEKWVFFVRFSVAEVLSVSTVAVQGRAEVMAVSRWPAVAVAEVLSVSTVAVHGRAMVMVVSRWPAVAVAEVAVVAPSPRRCTLCAKEFAQRTKNGPK